MVNLAEITSHLDAVLEPHRWGSDSNGLIVAGRSNVTRIGGAVNMSWSALKTAVDQGCDLVVSHHAAWASTDADLSRQKYDFARSAGLSLYVAHESLDQHPELGNAVLLCRCLGLPLTGKFFNGMGAVAGLQNPLSFESLLRTIREKVNQNALCWEAHSDCRSIAVLSGWGARPEWMAMAQEAGADTFVSGEAIHFGKLYAAETQMNLILAGHYATETPAVKEAIKSLEAKFGIESVFLEDPKSRALF